jgi:hypothetical protein
LRNPHLFLHGAFKLYRSVINQFSVKQTKKHNLNCLKSVSICNNIYVCNCFLLH